MLPQWCMDYILFERGLEGLCVHSVFMKSCCGRDKIFSLQCVAQNSACLNMRIMKRGQNDPHFQCYIMCTAFVNSPTTK